MSEQKICKNCKHCNIPNITSYSKLIYNCTRNVRESIYVDMVTGETTAHIHGLLSCKRERERLCVEVDHRCGYEGKYWEPKE